VLLCLTGVLCSFALLSPWRSPFLDSDQSLQILMTTYLRLPGDFYFWGQDRLGSLVPILAHGLYTLFHMSPALAASLVLYGLVAVLVLVMVRFIPSLSGRIMLVFLLFFPIHVADNMLKLGHPYAPQYACIAIFIACMYRFKTLVEESSVWKAALFLFLGILALDAALWISEMSIVALLAFAIAVLVAKGSPALLSKQTKASVRIFFIYAFLSLVTLGAGLWFIFYAKSQARAVPTYDQQWLASAGEIRAGATTYMESYGNTLLCKNDILTFLYALLFLCLLGNAFYVLCLQIVRSKKAPEFLSLFLLLNGIGGELLILLSKWVALNHFNSWYQTYPYVSLVLFILLVRERHPRNKLISGLSLTWVLVAVVSASSIYYFQQGKDPNQRSLREMSALNTLAPCAFIGDYWNSYLLWAANPLTLKAVPYEYPRCPWNVDSVMASPAIYLVRNNWLDSFPQQITLYNHSLRFTHDTLMRSGFYLGKYKEEKLLR
jgi:hypothetical protein